jgi:hypothetical protein
MKTRVIVIGYYDHFNLGDEQYKLTIQNIFNPDEYSLDFIDCDKCKNIDIPNDAIIILGGGDILNNYFLETINEIFKNKSNKIIALSVGLPYKNILINTSLLHIIDYFFIRSLVDIELFKSYFGKERVFYLPDLSYLTLFIQETIHSESEQLIYSVISNLKQNYNYKKKIGICLSRHLYKKGHLQNYLNIIHQLSDFIKVLVSLNYHIVFIPFNTNRSNTNENDIIIQNDIISILEKNAPQCISNITIIDFTITPLEMLHLFQCLDYTIPMRFHAVLYSMYTGVPFFPIFTTRKIRNLLNDICWNFGYQLDLNEHDLPVEIVLDICLRRFNILVDIYKNKERLRYKFNEIHTHFYNGIEKISNEFKKVLSTEILHKNTIQNKSIDKIDIIEMTLTKIKEFYYKRTGKILEELYDIQDVHLQNLIVQMVAYYLTNGTINSIYNYGLKEKMFKKDFNYNKEWEWIIQDIQTKKQETRQINNSKGLFNLNFIDQMDYSGAHRFGWQYVYENIKYLNNDNSDILFDLYIDRTFHWNMEINEAIGLIPYQKKWVGVVHHTFDTTFSEYNCVNLINNPLFLKSLEHCKGLIVLSNYLKDQFITELEKKGLNIPVYHLIHPTEIRVPQFNFLKFLNNPDKKLVHIGGWLRDTYSFFCVSTPEKTKIFKYWFKCNNEKINQVSLLGKHMSNYYPLPNTIELLEKSLAEQNCSVGNCSIGNCSVGNCSVSNCSVGNCSVSNCSVSNCSVGNCSVSNCSVSNCSIGNCSSGNMNHNNWSKLFLQDTNKKINQMKYITYLPNEEYDKLLCENIIFINLVDASAVNTLLECIVRNTPVIVNKHPAVVELLGEDYPLYYTDSTDYLKLNVFINNVLKNSILIRKSHNYLKRLDKTKLEITTFRKNLIDIFLKINL